MNPADELVLDVRSWLDTWAPNCGAPREVFEGQFKALVENLLKGFEPYPTTADVMGVVRRACR